MRRTATMGFGRAFSLLFPWMIPHVAGQDPLTTFPQLTDMLRFLPTQSPTRCDSVRISPAVDYSSSYSFRAAESSWSWSSAQPDQLTETTTGTVFPNPSYPIVYRNVTSASGRNVTLQYTLGTPSSQQQSRRCAQGYCEPAYTSGVWLEGCLNNFKADYFYRYVLSPLVSRYDGTSATERYALRVIELLDAWAAVWPDYVFRVTNTAIIMSPDDCYLYGPIGTGSTCCCVILSHYNGQAHELDRVPLAAYNKVNSSSSAGSYSAARGYDVLERVRTNSALTGPIAKLPALHLC